MIDEAARKRIVDTLDWHSHTDNPIGPLWCNLRIAVVGSSVNTHCDDMTCNECHEWMCGVLRDLIAGE